MNLTKLFGKVARASSIGFCFALVLVCLGETGFAQGFSYTFPGITNNDITVGNLNAGSTTATVSFYDTAGKLTSQSYELLSGTQTRVNATALSLTNFKGTVVVSGPLPLTVSADQFEGNTPFDFIYPSDVGTNLIVPFTPSGNTDETDFNVFNPGPNQAEVKIVLVASDGSHGVVRTITLDILHSATISVTGDNAAFAFVTTTNVLRPTAPVAVSAVVRTFQPSSTGAVKRTDFAIIPGMLQSSFTKTSVQIPFFAQGPDYFTDVQIDNISNVRQTFLVTATQSDGNLLANAPNNPATIVLPPYGSVTQEMATMFGNTVTSLTTGTITVTSLGSENNAGPTAGAAAPIYAVAAIGNIIEPGLAVVLPSKPQTSFSYQVRGTGPDQFFTGLSLQNPGGSDAHVTMSYASDAGDTIGSTTLTISAAAKGQPVLQKITTLGDLLPEALGNGYLVVKSDQPIIVVGVDGRADNSALATRQPTFAANNFTPRQQTSFAIAGTVRDQVSGVNGQNIGVPNIAMTLSSGDTTVQTTASDRNGRYTFGDLAAGGYLVTPQPVGYTVQPNAASAPITTSNSRGNDFAIGLTKPSILTINPASAQVLSSNPNATTTGVTITIQGSQGNNFVPSTQFSGNIFTGNNNTFTTGTVLVFNDSQVTTTVSSPTLLTANVPSNLLVAPGTVQVKLRNIGPSGDFVESDPVSFTIGTAAPTLTSVTNVPTPLILGQVTQKFTVTVNGSGFTPATQMRVNFVNRNTKYINQNQVQGDVLPQDLVTPGPIPITVQNPNTVDSSPFNLTLYYPIPVIAPNGVSPSSMLAQVAINSQSQQVTITGSNFSQSPTDLLSQAVVQVNGTTVQTQYISTTSLTALIPPSMINTPGALSVTVVNPTPSLAPSNVAPIQVNNPLPVISQLNGGGVTWNPNSPPNTQFSQPVVVLGNNFAPNADAWYTPPCDTLGIRKALSTVWNNSTQIIATIQIRCAGTYVIYINNPPSGGGLSAPVNLVVPSVAASIVELPFGVISGLRRSANLAVQPDQQPDQAPAQPPADQQPPVDQQPAPDAGTPPASN
jgi:hypothetical protein